MEVGEDRSRQKGGKQMKMKGRNTKRVQRIYRKKQDDGGRRTCEFASVGLQTPSRHSPSAITRPAPPRVDARPDAS